MSTQNEMEAPPLRTLTLADIQALAHGESVPRFTGKIRKVWDQKSDVGEYGRWYLQNLIVKMDDGNELSVTWTGEDKFDKTWEGADVAFECGVNDEGRLVGVVRDIRHSKKDGKVFKGVKVTPAGKVKRLDAVRTTTGDEPDAKWPGEEQKAEPSFSGAPSSSDKIELYAAHAARIFKSAWDQAGEIMEVIVDETAAAQMTTAEYYDLKLRIAQGFGIEVDKILRKERF